MGNFPGTSPQDFVVFPGRFLKKAKSFKNFSLLQVFVDRMGKIVYNAKAFAPQGAKWIVNCGEWRSPSPIRRRVAAVRRRSNFSF